MWLGSRRTAHAAGLDVLGLPQFRCNIDDPDLRGWKLPTILAALILTPLISFGISAGGCPNPYVKHSNSTIDFREWQGVLRDDNELLSPMNQRLQVEMSFVASTGFVEQGISRVAKLSLILEGRMSSKGDWERVGSGERRRTVVCEIGEPRCSPLSILSAPSVDYAQYRVHSKMDEASVRALDEFVTEGVFQFKYINAAFTIFQLVIKYIFFLITLVMFAWYFRQFRHVTGDSSGSRMFDSRLLPEQRLITVLFVALLLFNDPLFAVTVIVGGWVLPLVSLLLQSLFLLLCLYFVLVALDVLFGPEDTDHASSSPRCLFVTHAVVVGLLWVMAITPAIYAHVTQVADPTFNVASDFSGYVAMRAVAISIALACFLWLLYLLVRRCDEQWRALAAGSNRAASRRFFFVSACSLVMLISLAVCAVMWGLDVPPLPLAGLTADYATVTYWLTFTILCNMYVFALAWAYAPLPEDEPEGISMLWGAKQ